MNAFLLLLFAGAIVREKIEREWETFLKKY